MVERIAHATGISEARQVYSSFEVGLKCLERLWAETIHLLSKHELRYCEQLIECVIGKIEVMSNARTDARVGLKEGVHALLVACENDDEIVALALHHLEQNFDGFLPIVPFVLLAVEVVGFVNEKHPAHSPLEDLFGFGSSMTNVLANQVIACHRYQVPFARIAEPVQDRRHAHSYRRLPGAWWASKGHVQRRWSSRQPQAMTHPINLEQGSDFPNACLDRLETHQFLVKLVQHLHDLGFLENLCYIYLGIHIIDRLEGQLRIPTIFSSLSGW